MTDLDTLIGLIYEAALQPALWDDVLDGIAAVTPAEVATLYAHDRVARAPALIRIRGMDQATLADFSEHYAASNPIIDGLARLSPGDVAGLETILDYEAFKRHPYYTDWGRPKGYVDSIHIVLERTPARVASLSVIRNDGHGMADGPAIGRLKRLAPHVLRAVRIARVLEHADVRFERLNHAIDSLATAILLIERSGALLHANEAGAALLARGVSARRIAAGMTSGGGDAVFVTTRDGERLVCHVLPLSRPEAAAYRPSAGAAGLAVIRSLDVSTSGIEVAGVQFGLTSRERDVLLGLVELGGTPSTAAVLGISVATARTHLQALFRKTGTSRQSELVQLVSNLASPFGTPEPSGPETAR